jgi:class 3 adenylate cyclase
MRAVVQRVTRAKVTVSGDEVGAIGPGLCALVGVTHDDGPDQARALAGKLWNLRILADEDGVMNRSVADAGGEILSFVGDGFLAIFPSGRNQKESAEACKLALSAALEATHRMAEANRQRAARGETALGYGLALHIGNVMFGNVGLAERLSFSVFGSTVNEVVRLETLTKKFGSPIVASEEFKTYCGGEWDSLGRESLRGVNNAMAVFRPLPLDAEVPEVPIVKRSRVRDFSDAEAVILLHRDTPTEGGPAWMPQTNAEERR